MLKTTSRRSGAVWRHRSAKDGVTVIYPFYARELGCSHSHASHFSTL